MGGSYPFLRSAVLMAGVATLGGPAAEAVHFGPMEAGYAYVEKGDLDSALREFKKAIAIAPNDTRGQFGIGYIYLKWEEPTLAIPYLKTAFEVAHPGDRTGRLNAAVTLAEAYTMVGDADHAVAWLREGRLWFEQLGWAEEGWRQRLAGPSFEALKRDSRYQELARGKADPLEKPER
jgi:tetratricopeptide (TPR) repeat protein